MNEIYCQKAKEIIQQTHISFSKLMVKSAVWDTQKRGLGYLCLEPILKLHMYLCVLIVLSFEITALEIKHEASFHC